MSGWAKPGVKCVCVDADFYGRTPVLSVGSVYVVKKVAMLSGSVRHGFEHLCVELEGVRNPFNDEGDWLAVDRFRPIVTKTLSEDIALFKAISEDSLGRLEVLEEELNR